VKRYVAVAAEDVGGNFGVMAIRAAPQMVHTIAER
jgi:hypothetical protein